MSDEEAGNRLFKSYRQTEEVETPPVDEVIPPVDEVIPPTDEVIPPVDEVIPPEEEPGQPKVPEVHSLDEAAVLGFLSEKLGKDYSWDDIEGLGKESTNPFANETIQAANDYMRDTGNPIESYFELQRLSAHTDMTAEALVKERMKFEDPDLNSAQIDFMYNRQFSKLEINDEEMSNEEISKAKEHNMYVDIQLHKEQKKSAAFIEGLVDKYKAPAPRETEGGEPQFDSAEYTSAWQESVSDMESFEFKTGKDTTFKYAVSDEARNAINTPRTPEAMIENRYVADGELNVEKFAQDMFILENLDSIILAASASRKTDGVKEVLSEIEGSAAKSDRLGTPGSKKETPASETISMAQHMFRNR